MKELRKIHLNFIQLSILEFELFLENFVVKIWISLPYGTSVSSSLKSNLIAKLQQQKIFCLIPKVIKLQSPSNDVDPFSIESVFYEVFFCMCFRAQHAIITNLF